MSLGFCQTGCYTTLGIELLLMQEVLQCQKSHFYKITFVQIFNHCIVKGFGFAYIGKDTTPPAAFDLGIWR